MSEERKIVWRGREVRIVFGNTIQRWMCGHARSYQVKTIKILTFAIMIKLQL